MLSLVLCLLCAQQHCMAAGKWFQYWKAGAAKSVSLNPSDKKLAMRYYVGAISEVMAMRSIQQDLKNSYTDFSNDVFATQKHLEPKDSIYLDELMVCMAERVNGANSPKCLPALEVLGAAYFRADRFTESAAAFRRIVTIWDATNSQLTIADRADFKDAFQQYLNLQTSNPQLDASIARRKIAEVDASIRANS